MLNELNRALGPEGERFLTAYETEAVVGASIGTAVTAAYHWLADRLGVISEATRTAGPAV